MKLFSIILIIIFICISLNGQNVRDSDKKHIKSILTRKYRVELVNDSVLIKNPSIDDYEEYNLDGKIAETNIFFTDDGYEVRFRYYYESNKLILKESYKYDNTLFRKYFYYYDNTDHLIRNNVYEVNDYLFMQIMFTNNQTGKPIKEVKLNGKGDTLFIYFSNYDTLGNLIEKKYFGLKNNFYKRDCFRYDNNSNMIEKLWYRDNEELSYRFEYQYDSLNRIKIIRDYPQGELFDTTTYYEQTEFFYDFSKSNSIGKKVYRPSEKSTLKERYTYEYDEYSNWIEMKVYNSLDKLMYIVKREIEYYD